MKQILPLLAVGLMLLSCIDDPPTPPTLEEQYENDLITIDTYLTSNSLTAEIEPASGIRYIIIEQGDGNAPVDTDGIVINYVGKHLSGDIFDQGDTITFTLNTLIAGWRVGLPLLNERGSMTLFLPSVYGYGNTPVSGIPAGSVLIFDIDLIEIL